MNSEKGRFVIADSDLLAFLKSRQKYCRRRLRAPEEIDPVYYDRSYYLSLRKLVKGLTMPLQAMVEPEWSRWSDRAPVAAGPGVLRI